MINNFEYVVTKNFGVLAGPVAIVSSEEDAWTFIEISLNDIYNKFEQRFLNNGHFIRVFIDSRYKQVFCGFYDPSDNIVFDTTFSIIGCPKYEF